MVRARICFGSAGPKPRQGSLDRPLMRSSCGRGFVGWGTTRPGGRGEMRSVSKTGPPVAGVVVATVLGRLGLDGPRDVHRIYHI